MKIEVLNETGLQEALLGLSLSYNCPPDKDMLVVANKLFDKEGGHNVFLEQLQIWVDINAPRYWWQQFDRYRVGTTRQSESTMHTILKKELTQDNFSVVVPYDYLNYLNELRESKHLDILKALLPEGFLQRRVCTINYKSLRNYN